MSSHGYSDDTTMSWLRGLAGLLIFAGIVAAIGIWAVFGTVEVTSGTYSTRTTTEPNPVGVIFAVATGFQALLIGVFLFVFARLVESVWRIETAIESMTKHQETEQNSSAGEIERHEHRP